MPTAMTFREYYEAGGGSSYLRDAVEGLSPTLRRELDAMTVQAFRDLLDGIRARETRLTRDADPRACPM